MKQALITIVTICYNISNELEKTMQSVINQTYRNIEYIIIDGGSSDNSVDIIKSHEKIALEKGILFKWISEPDEGIYDAMNKGVDLATGEWINFMNGGDGFYDVDVISDISTSLDKEYAVITGFVNYVFSKNNEKIKYLKQKNKIGLFNIQFPSHQASFIRMDLMKRYMYDSSFKIRGDTDFFAKILISGEKWGEVSRVICDFNICGVSSSPSWCMFRESVRIGNKYLKLFWFGHSLYYLFCVIPRVMVRKMLPSALEFKIRKMLIK